MKIIFNVYPLYSNSNSTPRKVEGFASHPDTVEFSSKPSNKSPVFTGFFSNLFKKKGQAETSVQQSFNQENIVSGETLEPEKISSGLEKIIPEQKEEFNEPQEQIYNQEDIIGPYIETPQETIDELYQKRLGNLLSPDVDMSDKDFISAMTDILNHIDCKEQNVEIFKTILTRIAEAENPDIKNDAFACLKMLFAKPTLPKDQAQAYNNNLIMDAMKGFDKPLSAVNDFIDKRFCNGSSDIDYVDCNPTAKNLKGGMSMLDIALDTDKSSEYNDEFIREHILYWAALDDTLKFDDIVFPNDLTAKPEKIANIDMFFNVLLESNPGLSVREKIVDFYKNFYKNGGRNSFEYAQDNYAYAKVLLDAGVQFDSVDINGRIFRNVVKDLTDENGNSILPFSETVEPYLNRKDIIWREKDVADIRKFMTSILTQCSDIHSKEEKFLEMVQTLEDKQKSDDYFYRKNAEIALLYLPSCFSKSFEANKFDCSVACEEFRRLSDKYNDGEKTPENKKLLNSLWMCLPYDVQIDMMEELLPLRIETFTFKNGSCQAAAEVWLNNILKKIPDFRDGISKMGDFGLFLHNVNAAVTYRGFNIEINEEKETALDIFIKTTCNDDYEKYIQEHLIKNLGKFYFVDLYHCDKYGNNYAMKAVMAENLPMIKFLLERNVDFGVPNKFGKSAMDVAMESSNQELKDLLKDVKIHSDELLELARMGSVVGMKMLLDKGYIDVNSKSAYSNYTPWLLAAEDGKIETAEFLKDIPEVDFKAVQCSNNNFAMIAIKNKHLDFIKQIFPKLTAEQLDINYINPDNESVYSLAVNLPDEYLEEILKVESADPNISTPEHPALAYQLIKRNQLSKFKILAESGKLDLNAKCRIDSISYTLADYINNCFMTPQDHKRYLEILSCAVDKNVVSDVKKCVDANGFLSLQNIIEYLNYPHIDKVITNNLSDSNEKIGHLLADIAVTPFNFMQILQAAKKIISLDSEAFTYKDKYGQTPIERALIAENDILFEYIAQNSLLTGFDIEKLKKLSEEIPNTNIKNVISKLKPTKEV